MTAAQIAALVGYMMGAWGIGFAMGHYMTKFKEAMSQVL